ncbi:HutD/Ves family protein [Thalassotalea atypica]|uniref:HutD/Ves family protein n=1 Tax=Thalassotalea atypica TaxID=2054316 RepID=UPI002572A200|nr:HutD family protein [Thalassotalea atypica]
MFTLISPQQYRKIPWKNGLGHTLELAISPGGTINDFDWRLSIATVAQNGVFSNFSGYSRKLVLISGQGVSLTHDKKQTDELSDLLQYSCFDGGAQTMSLLHGGPIDDFNVMVKQGNYQADVLTFNEVTDLNFTVDELTYIYSVTSDIALMHPSQESPVIVPKHHLLAISADEINEVERPFGLSGKMIIVVKLKKVSEV